MPPYRRILNFICRPVASQEGIALILVIWVVVLLTIIITEFTFSTRTESTIAANFKEDTQCYYLALAGFNKAMAERLNPLVNCVLTDQSGKMIFKEKPALNKTTGTYDQSHDITTEDIPKRTNLALSQGTYSYDIVDEGSKIDLNALARDTPPNREILKRLLKQGAGMQEGADMDIIIDSIFDWVDPHKDIHRANGAKDDYYHGLPNPYDCKNGNFYTVDELLLVRGITPEIMYGSNYYHAGNKADESPQATDQAAHTSGIARYLTVWGGGAPNPYTSDADTLKIYYGEEAGESMRKNLFDENGNPKDCNNTSATFSITAHGQMGAMSHHIFGVVHFGFKNNAPQVSYLFWNDNYIPPQQAQQPNQPPAQASMFPLEGLLKLFVGARFPRPD